MWLEMKTMSFSALDLCDPLLSRLGELGYIEPTPIQQKAIPAVLAGRDVLAVAQTGTGKTAGFVLPMLQRLTGSVRVRSNHVRALILTPTRELALQVEESFSSYGNRLRLTSSVVYGGVKINPQMMKLRGGVDILVATPGRLLDLLQKNALKLGQIEICVLDEADRMLDMGFAEDVSKILALLPTQRQSLLFSATFSDEIRTLSKKLLKKPVQIEVGPRNSAASSVHQCVYEVDKAKKTKLLSHLIRTKGWRQILVFTRTKIGADLLVKKLGRDGLSAMAIHGDKSQAERSRALATFKAGDVRLLVATDIAARGLDISELPCVINFDLPRLPENYLHRIGRTGRAGLKGVAVSLVSADEVKLLVAVEAVIAQALVREIEPGFVPTDAVPKSHALQRKKSAKKIRQKQEPDVEMITNDGQNGVKKHRLKSGVSLKAGGGNTNRNDRGDGFSPVKKR
jgi:ATP-dependent RNA helicase RhlE